MIMFGDHVQLPVAETTQQLGVADVAEAATREHVRDLSVPELGVHAADFANSKRSRNRNASGLIPG